MSDTSTIDPAFIARVADGLRRQQGELVETVRTMRFALDDLCGVPEHQRRGHEELLALLERLAHEVTR